MGLQAMIDICQKFALDHNLKFSTNSDPNKSKTKCIHFSRKNVDLANITLNGDKLPWVENAKHVGNILQRDNSFSKDISSKRGQFIGKVHCILQEFHFANPMVKMNLISKFATSFYGSSLWSIFDGMCDKFFTAWNNTVRDTFGLPCGSHRYFIEEISDHLHPMVMFSSRFVQFHRTLQANPKSCMRYLSSLSSFNSRTAYCKNLRTIMEKSNSDADRFNVSSAHVKRIMKYCRVPENSGWKVKVVQDLLELRWNLIDIDVLEDDTDLEALVSQICLS